MNVTTNLCINRSIIRSDCGNAVEIICEFFHFVSTEISVLLSVVSVRRFRLNIPFKLFTAWKRFV